MDRLDAMQLFLDIVQHGSLSAAARARSISLPTVVRRLADLERHLGVRLLQRTTRRSHLTDAGREYLERARIAVSAVEDAEAAVSAQGGEPRGRLAVTAPLVFGRLHVGPLVREFLASHAQVTVDLLLVDRVVDLVAEGVDVAVRIAQLPDSTLVAKTVGSVRRVICAAPAYLARHAAVERPADLEGHACIAASPLISGDQWHITDPDQPRRPIRPRSMLRTNSIDVAVDACIDGLGIGVFFSYQVASAIEDGRLVPLLDPFGPPPVPVSLVYPSARLQGAAARAFVALAQRSTRWPRH